jgi:zinc D-Ala-D-Ala carboxypeptidase
MLFAAPTGTPHRRTRSTLLVARVLVCAALAAVVGCQWLAPTSSSANPAGVVRPLLYRIHADVVGAHRVGAAEADGAVPDGVTVLDDEYPAVANLDPALLRALRRAANDAARDHVVFYVNSGWRSAAYQQQLLDEAVARYGSADAAARWVATPDTSPHVAGEAVDLGHSDAAKWLSHHGAVYGLCQVYDNEPWHYELRPDTIHHGCPAKYADAAHDPRMQR